MGGGGALGGERESRGVGGKGRGERESRGEGREGGVGEERDRGYMGLHILTHTQAQPGGHLFHRLCISIVLGLLEGRKRWRGEGGGYMRLHMCVTSA